MLARIKNQLHQIENKQKLSNIINPKLLSEIEIITLKKVISAINNHQSIMSIEFGGF
jgi:signal-transduction protein with cAMP-binding, CBS, and nucleotidyltransferase domain